MFTPSTNLLWGYTQSDGTQVNLLIWLYAGQNEEYTWIQKEEEKNIEWINTKR